MLIISNNNIVVPAYVLLQEGVFFRFGQLSAMALIQGGGAMNFLGPSTYNFMCGMKPADVIVSEEEITDYEVKLILQKVPTTCTI